ncbi:MAG TPA: hypothetical protein VKQ73_00330 [Stellaceae bacterium]|nr:hypothetical protein [Stellaceae bacterium]
MNNKFRTMAVVAALATLPVSVAMAQACPPGYGLSGGVCQPIAGAVYAPSNPVSGAVSGEAAGAASGAATGGPVGAVVGGAIGAATGTIAGTANAVAGAPVYGTSVPPAPACAPGYVLYSGGCYPAR